MLAHLDKPQKQAFDLYDAVWLLWIAKIGHCDLVLERPAHGNEWVLDLVHQLLHGGEDDLFWLVALTFSILKLS